MEIYTDFAMFYDHFMDDVPYDEWGEFIREMLLTYGGQEDRAICDLQGKEPTKHPLVLDLGCGTGTMTEKLASYGYDMIGIDSSSAMLEIAKNKEESSHHNILYLQQDMREFELYGSVTAVVCVCDSINYILELSELKQVFCLVNHYLDPGGLFIFDFNTDYKYREVIGNQTIAENRQDKSFIWENYYYQEEKINEMELSLFIKDGLYKGEAKMEFKRFDSDGVKNKLDNRSEVKSKPCEEKDNKGELYRKYKEIHYQRAYHLEEIKEALEEAGLEFIKAYDDYTCEEVHKDSQRVVVVAKK